MQIRNQVFPVCRTVGEKPDEAWRRRRLRGRPRVTLRREAWQAIRTKEVADMISGVKRATGRGCHEELRFPDIVKLTLEVT